ncbi:MAG: peptidyl-tRNA hydrolase [Arenicella sp.]|jgi:peptidyl-tRNA hydrolase
MYILLKETLPNKFAPVVSAHASLACYKKFEEDENMQIWMSSVFKKVVCKVTEAEFEKTKEEEKYLVLTESALDNAEVAIAFSPREEYPKRFKFFRMWTPT